jgi:hypothetical protein
MLITVIMTYKLTLINSLLYDGSVFFLCHLSGRFDSLLISPFVVLAHRDNLSGNNYHICIINGTVITYRFDDF